MSILSPSRCVLLLTDEGLSVFDTAGNKVKLVDSLPWETDDFPEALVERIKKSKASSILILNDMVEQHYRKERIPKVGSFDKANVIKHRVSAAFPAYPIRSAIKLKEKPVPRDGEEVPGDIYLFAAVPSSENIKKTLTGVKKSYKNISGFCLLPVESSSMVHALSKKISKASDGGAVWTVFVGQHHGGGLRQIVTKNGELALTRLTPFLDSDQDGDLWATETVNELKGTMSYLSRFGFDPRDGLDVVIIANNAVADKIVSRVDFDCNLNVLTAMEAANLLGLSVGKLDSQRYADPLHIAWAAKKSALALPLQATELEDISGPANIAMAASVLLFAGCCYFAYDAYTTFSSWSSARSELSVAKEQLAEITQKHEEETARKNSTGADYLLVESSTDVYDRLEKKAMKPLPVLDMVGRALGTDIHIASMEIKPYAAPQTFESRLQGDEESAEPELDENGKIKPTQFGLVLSIKFPSRLAPEVGVQKVVDFQKRLMQNLPNYEVIIIKQVADLTYTGNFVGEATSNKKVNGEKEDYEAQIMIKGTML